MMCGVIFGGWWVKVMTSERFRLFPVPCPHQQLLWLTPSYAISKPYLYIWSWNL